MKLSEAIRLGSTLHPQGYGAYAKEHIKVTLLGGTVIATEIRTCAYGGALIAIGNSVESCMSNDIGQLLDVPDEWDYFTDGRYDCPAGCVTVDEGADIIFHLNDTHKWSRGRIADWVQSVEMSVTTTLAAVPEELVPTELVAA